MVAVSGWTKFRDAWPHGLNPTDALGVHRGRRTMKRDSQVSPGSTARSHLFHEPGRARDRRDAKQRLLGFDRGRIERPEGSRPIATSYDA
jgi:hypothetical protein